MSETTDHIVIDDNSCPSLDHLMKHKESALDSRESHLVEKHLLSCSMCNEVIGHLSTTNLAEMSAISMVIDQQVDARVGKGGSGSCNIDFNAAMILAAGFIGVLMLVGNLFIGTDTLHGLEEPSITIEQTDEHTDVEKDGPVVSLSENTEVSDPVDASSEGSLSGTIVVEGVDTVGDDLADPVDPINDPDDDVVLHPSDPDDKPADDKPAPTNRYLMASIDVIIMEMIGTPPGKGSTDKKVKIKNNKGYAPEYDEEDFPMYKGGESALKEDIVELMNKLQLSLVQGGVVQVIFRVKSNGAIGSINVDDKVSIALSNRIRDAISSLPRWIGGNVEIQYTMNIVMR